MGIAEKYSRSVNSSNLKDDEHHHDTETLAAVALTGVLEHNRLGPALFRVKFANDHTSYATLLASWEVVVGGKAVKRRWSSDVTAKKVAALSLGHWLNDICPVCTGKGHQAVFGTPMLSDDPCPACLGQGKKPLVCDVEYRDPIVDMIEILDRMINRAVGEAMRKLAGDMEF